MPHDLGRATQSARTFRDRAIPECDDSMPHAKHQPPLAAKLEYPTTIFLPLLNNTQRSNCARVDDDTAHAYASNKRQPAAHRDRRGYYSLHRLLDAIRLTPTTWRARTLMIARQCRPHVAGPRQHPQPQPARRSPIASPAQLDHARASWPGAWHFPVAQESKWSLRGRQEDTCTVQQGMRVVP